MKLTKEDIEVEYFEIQVRDSDNNIVQKSRERVEKIRLDRLREVINHFLDEYDGDDKWFFDLTMENLFGEVMEDEG